MRSLLGFCWISGIALLLLLGACGGAPTDNVRQLSLGHVGAPGSLFARSAEEFARRVNQRLAGKLEIQVFGSSQIGGDEVLLRKLKVGTVDFALPSTIMSSYVDIFGLFDMPYLIRDRDHMRHIEREIVWPRMAPLAEEAGYKLLAIWENGFRHITNNLRPIEKPADLAGIKLRTPSGRWRVRMFQAFGANPTPMPLSEVFVALQTGVMDGQENPLIQIYSSRLHEVQKFLSLAGHVYTPAYLTVSAQHWQRIPEELRRVIEETAREVQDSVYQTAAELDANAVDQLEQAGIQINRPQLDAFRQASQPVYAEFASQVAGGQELIDRALETPGSR